MTHGIVLKKFLFTTTKRGFKKWRTTTFIRCLIRSINLIRFHAGLDRGFPSSYEKEMEWFGDYLTNNGITTTIRRSRGEDILAACGLLAAKEAD